MIERINASRHLLDGVQVAFLLTDAHSTILYANHYATYLFGYERGEIEGQRMRVLFLEEDLVYFLPNIIYLTLYQEGFDGEALLRQKDGKGVFVHLKTTSFKEKGEVFLTFSLKEIQRLKTLEQESLESEHWATLGRMVQGVAHQVRNPAVAIGGLANRLLKVSSSSEGGKSYVTKILREARRLEKMVHQVEEYVRIPSLRVKRERVLEVVEATIEAFSRETREKGVSIHLDTGRLEEGRYFFADKAQVIRALSHLLDNSLEALRQLPRKRGVPAIEIVVSDREGTVRISVSDRGEGIPKKNLGRIFEPFFSTRPDRTGLGLTFVRKVMEKHGGRVEIESQLRKRTTVALSFPKDRRRRVRREFLSPEVAGGEVG
jgi:PAS domain S-box-containing protein